MALYNSRIASKSVTISSGSLVDDDGIKTSIATSTSPVTYVAADFNGAQISSATGRIIGLPRVLTITRSNNAAQFSTGGIVVSYKRGGALLTETITPANANGNDTLVMLGVVDELISVAFPAQGGTGGTFKIGVRDICSYAQDTFVGVEVAAAGTLYVQYGEGTSASQDGIPIATAAIGAIKPICPTRILTDATKTTVGVTVYLP